MAERSPSSTRTARPGKSLPGLRIVFIGIALVSLALGFFGFREYCVCADPCKGTNTRDHLYYAFQLFALGAPPLDEGGGFPLPLEIARFTAPAVTIYAFFEAGRLLFASELIRIRARRARDHAIVCGSGPLATSLIQHLVTAGSTVVHVTATPSRRDSGRSILVVAGDARDPGVLDEAGITHARVLYACTGDSAANTAIALTASARVPQRHRTAAYAHVSDPELCLALQARHLGADPGSTLRVDFFNMEDLAARSLCEAQQLSGGTRPPRLLFLGANHFCCAVILEAARQWRVSEAAAGGPLRLTIVDPRAAAVIGLLTDRYPFLAQTCRISVRPDLSTLPQETPEAFDRVFICYEEDELALKAALTTDRFLTGGEGSVIVRQNQLAPLRNAFGTPPARQLFDEVSSTIRLFGVVDAAADPRQIHNDLARRLARVLHESYLISARERGAWSPSMVPWPDLPDWLKRENRALAADIGRKLSLIDCMLAPRIGRGAEHTLTPAEIELLAVREHERWCEERVAAGWRHGPRDDTDKRHPALVPWEELGEPDRARDRDAVAKLPEILADCGFRIVSR